MAKKIGEVHVRVFGEAFHYQRQITVRSSVFRVCILFVPKREDAIDRRLNFHPVVC